MPMIDDKVLKAIGKTAFPGYHGRKFKTAQTRNETHTVFLSGINWDSGSRDEYVLMTICPIGIVKTFGHLAAMFPGTQPAEEMKFVLEPNHCLVRHSIFMGKDTGITITFRSDNT